MRNYLQPDCVRDRPISDLAKLVAQFYAIKRDLDDHIHQDDAVGVQTLDRELTHLCETILAREVDCERERVEKLDFLLDLFVPAGERTPLQERTCEAIRRVVLTTQTPR